jgi:hypothetical protein
VEAIGQESKAMRIVNSVTVLDLVWSGPHQLADLVAFNSAEDYGIYQIYGTHGVNGPDNLLYIGMAQCRPFSVRGPEGKGSRGKLTVLISILVVSLPWTARLTPAMMNGDG